MRAATRRPRARISSEARGSRVIVARAADSVSEEVLPKGVAIFSGSVRGYVFSASTRYIRIRERASIGQRDPRTRIDSLLLSSKKKKKN